MTKKSLYTLITILYFSSASFCQEEKEEVTDSPLVIASWPTHPEPYDIASYTGKAWQELLAIARPHMNHQIYVGGPTTTRLVPSTCFVDDDWKIICNIYQSLIRERKEDVFTSRFNSEFSRKRAGMRLFNRIKTSWVLFTWRQAAWVHPDDADALVYVLTHGFRDKIAPNPEGACYWTNRARLLREARGWYIPVDKRTPPIVEGTDISEKVNIILGLVKKT